MNFKRTLLTFLGVGICSIAAISPNISREKEINNFKIYDEFLKKEIAWKKHYTETDSLLKLIPIDYISDETGKRLDGECSQYVRKAGKELFNLNYSWTDAWNRRNAEKVFYEFNSPDFNYDGKKKELDSLFEKGKLERGMIFGIYNSNRPEFKQVGKYTHVANWIGRDSLGQDIFIENRDEIQDSISLKRYYELGFDLREILEENLVFMAKYGK